jgi:hypothetical protein
VDLQQIVRPRRYGSFYRSGGLFVWKSWPRSAFFSPIPAPPSTATAFFSVLYSRFYIHVFLGGFGRQVAFLDRGQIYGNLRSRQAGKISLPGILPEYDWSKRQNIF